MNRMRIKVALGVVTLFLLLFGTYLIQVASSQQELEPSVWKDETVCIGPDSVLRAPPASSGICPKGTTQIALAAPVMNYNPDDDKDPLDPDPDKRPGSNNDAIAAIEKRISRLERSSLFEVVNKAGDVIFSVAPGRVQVYNEQRVPVAAILATDEGGEIVARSADGTESAIIGTYGARTGLRLLEGTTPRLDLLRRTYGNYSLGFPSANGMIAGIGESQAGTGAVVVGDIGGRKKTSMSIGDNAKGILGIYNDGGNGVLTLTEGATGGGLFAIGDANGEPMVKMGVKDDRYGVVLAGPVAGFPLIPSSGLPGSYILGCAGGGSCHPY